MPLFTVDENKCKKDGLCAAECPLFVIINFNDKDKVPFPNENTENLCMDCGHCVAICPTGALIHKNMSPEECLPVNKDMALNPEQAEQFLRSRRSIRHFKDKEVEKKKIEEIIRIAAHAPSGHNIQPVHWQVILGKEKIKEVTGLVADWMEIMIKEEPELAAMLQFEVLTSVWKQGMDFISRNAPAIILANGEAGDPSANDACLIGMSYLDLAIPSFGLGSCWDGFFQMAAAKHKPLQEALGFPENFTNYAALMLGYPKYKYVRMPKRNEARITWTE